jgi:hypothetical protein
LEIAKALLKFSKNQFPAILEMAFELFLGYEFLRMTEFGYAQLK